MKALASVRQSQLALTRVRAALLPIALLLPLWTIGIFGRSYWKPDEPREADIVWRMHLSDNAAIPTLDDTPFVEKPPLLYWAAQPFMNDGHAPAWRARVPNLLYASIVAICVFLLASEIASTAGAVIATLVTSSFLLNYQVAIWLATDAPMMAGVALSLLGLYRGYTANDNRSKLIFYTLMHSGLALAFMAKSAASWLVPGCAFATLALWDRNFRELLRWPLYIGAVIEVACIGSWLWCVSQAPQGPELLHQALWMNLVGRFLTVHSTVPGAAEYTLEHLNWFGKYFIEAPYFVFPWTFIVIAAVRRGWRALREGAHVRAWRFCIAATMPSLLLLSVAHTGRDIYIAPVLIGVGLACGLWLDAVGSTFDRVDAFVLRATCGLLAVFGAVLLLAFPITVIYARAESMSIWASVAGACIIAVASIRLLTRTPSGFSASERVRNLYAAYMFILVGMSFAYFPMLNRQQDLTPIGIAVRADVRGNPLVLVGPDETTRAFIDLEGLTAQRLARTDSFVADANILLQEQPQTRFLVKLREQHGPITDWFARRGRKPSSRDETLDIFSGTGLVLEKKYVIPDGRSYALLARPREVA
jgi:4-amino-4-deoxy-L-arabinose transferase-like glycosyltransferase